MKAIKFTRIWNIAYPIIIGNIAQNLLSITDTAFLGHLDDISLGAAALGGVSYLAIMMLGMGFGIGIQIIIARRRGEEMFDRIGPVLHHALMFMIPFALLLWMVFRNFGTDILSLVIRSPEVLESTSRFFSVRIWGILCGFVVYVGQAFFIGLAQTKIISVITSLMVVVNILFDWILIYGHFGFGAYGIEGAAAASVLSEIVAAVVYVVYIFKTRRFRVYGVLQKVHYSSVVMWNLIKISLPASLQNFLSVASWFVFFVMVEKLGSQELAVSNIGRSLYAVFMMPVWGLASATNSLVSYSIGSRKPLLVYPIMGKVVVLTLCCMLVLELLIWFFSGTVTSIYTNIPSLKEATIEIIPVISFSALLFGSGFICFNAVSGTGNTHISLMIEIVGTALYVAMIVLSVEVWNWGISLVWLADGLYGVVMAVLSLIYLAFGNWIKRKV